jgi:hypothetical protein
MSFSRSSRFESFASLLSHPSFLIGSAIYASGVVIIFVDILEVVL